MYNCKLQFVVSHKKNLMLKVSNKFNEHVRGKGHGLTEMVRKPFSTCRFFMYSESLAYATNSFRKVLIPSNSATTSQSLHSTPMMKATGRRTYEQMYCKE